MDSDIAPITPEQMHKLLQNLANFMALQEQADDRLSAKQHEVANQIAQFQAQVDSQIHRINQAIDEVSSVMSETGAARWRVAAESALKQGEGHAEALSEMINQFKVLSEKSIARMEQVSIEAEQRIAKLVSTLTIEQDDVIDHFKDRAKASYDELNRVTDNISDRLKKSSKWYSWDRIAIAIGAAIISALIVGMYLNAEAPWESYSRAHQERTVGRTFLAVWPTLTPAEKEHIKQQMGITQSKK